MICFLIILFFTWTVAIRYDQVYLRRNAGCYSSVRRQRHSHCVIDFVFLILRRVVMEENMRIVRLRSKHAHVLIAI